MSPKIYNKDKASDRLIVSFIAIMPLTDCDWNYEGRLAGQQNALWTTRKGGKLKHAKADVSKP